jgi:hypothetical protein
MSSASSRRTAALILRARLRAAILELADGTPALAVALPAIAWVWSATVVASWAALGRDQGIFQYVAWAVSQGDVAYRDVRDVNGPVITMVHLFFLALGGGEEHRFRVLDLVMTGASFAFAGACLPSFSGMASATRTSIPIASRVMWALAAWAALSAQYVAYGFWDTAQRESFLDWFVLVSIALQATRTADGDPGSPAHGRSRITAAILVASGATSFVSWLGKPTYAIFTVTQVLAILVGEGAWRVRARRLATFFAGGALGIIGPLVFVAVHGDLVRWAKITLVDVPAMYRFIWPRPASVILSFPGYQRTAWIALATTTGLALLIGWRRLPRRAIAIAALPIAGLVSVVVQAKGFPYHFHPVTLGIAFGWLVGLDALWRTSRGTLLRTAVVVGGALVGGHAALIASQAPYPPAPEPEARDKASLESAEHLEAFNRIDFFPRALRDAAEYVAARTRPGDRVQTYGMDAYVLFLAGRRSATPYVHAYDLNVDAALHGSFDPSGPHPTEEEAKRIRSMRDDHEADLLQRLERAPPAAFVFVDRSPLMSYVDSVEDFSTHCPDAAKWLWSHYRQTADFEGIRVWMRTDLE